MATAEELIEEARAALAAGKDGEAFNCLDKAVSNTADPAVLKQIHELATEGYERASFVAKHTKWGGLIKATEQGLALVGHET